MEVSQIVKSVNLAVRRQESPHLMASINIYLYHQDHRINTQYFEVCFGHSMDYTMDIFSC